MAQREENFVKGDARSMRRCDLRPSEILAIQGSARRAAVSSAAAQNE